MPDMQLRVAAYCRVSTDKDDQVHSMAAQRRFFRAYIEERPGWILAGIFADEGMSGTSVRRRPQFAEMFRLAMSGGVDLIVTKEVSRFARNTVDALQATRQLKEKGVGVLFLNDGIDTRDNDGEFRLTIMASVAQEESRKISDRTRWGQLQAMKRGVVFGNNSLYGYTVCKGALAIQPEQADIVRLIYRKFLLEGKGACVISRELTEAGVRPPLRASGAWTSGTVLRLLKNEKYCGDLLQKKYRTTDYLSHRKVANRGEEDRILLRDHHEPIVSREMFEAVQEELARRAGAAADHSRFSARYWFSGKVRCGLCGRSFTVKRAGRVGGRAYQRFVCRGRYAPEIGCPMRSVRGEILLACAQRVLRELAPDGGRIASELMRELRESRQEDGGRAQALRAAIRRQLDRKGRALEAYLDGDLDRDGMRRLTSRCEEALSRLREQLEEEERRTGAERAADRFQEALSLLERELAGGESVLDEIIRRITVFEDHFIIEVEEVPIHFRVRAESGGAGAGFHVAVTECVPLIPFPD